MATLQRDYYEVLGVPRDADQKAIKEAFRKLALRYHPDRNKAPDAGERFREIAEAYAVISDPKKRAGYDSQGFAGVAGFTPEDLFGGINFEDLLGGLHFDFGGGLFDGFFRRRSAVPSHGANMEVEIVIPLEKVASGGVEKVRLSKPETCPLCGGSGAKPGTMPRPCPECKGTGQEVKSRKERGITIQQITPCLNCRGKGTLIDQVCLKCGGNGESWRDEELEVTIPAGIEEGMSLRIPGKGMPSAQKGGFPGELFVVVQTRSDPRFKREGNTLWRTEIIPLTDAVLGATLEVPTLDGTATVKIPSGTQPDALLRLRGKGLPEFESKKRGDLYLRIQVHLPERLTAEERKLYEHLRELENKEPRSR
jgi:molecular chaperone DnaJ